MCCVLAPLRGRILLPSTPSRWVHYLPPSAKEVNVAEVGVLVNHHTRKRICDRGRVRAHWVVPSTAPRGGEDSVVEVTIFVIHHTRKGTRGMDVAALAGVVVEMSVFERCRTHRPVMGLHRPAGQVSFVHLFMFAPFVMVIS